MVGPREGAKVATYRVLSVEDSLEEARILREHLLRYGREHDIAFKLSWEQTALGIETSGIGYDLVFLDIDLPGINGIEAAELIRLHDLETPIVFVTNLAQYAIKGYEVDALGYVLKPMAYYNFSMLMDRALRVMRRNAVRSVRLATTDGMRVLSISDIVYVEVSGHYLNYVTADGDSVRVRGTMKAAEQDLPEASFVRISNSHLVNVDHFLRMRGDEVIMDNHACLFFSRSRKRAAEEKIINYLGGSV